MGLSIKIPFPQYIDGEGDYCELKDSGEWVKIGTMTLAKGILVQVWPEDEMEIKFGQKLTVIRRPQVTG